MTAIVLGKIAAGLIVAAVFALAFNRKKKRSDKDHSEQ